MNRHVAVRRLLPPTEELRWLGLLVALEAVALIAYFGLVGGAVTDVRYVVYPFVWINAGIWAVARSTPPRAPSRHRWVAAAIGGAYFLVLAFITGLIGIDALEHLLAGGHAHTHTVPPGLQVSMSPPGWGPRVALVSEGAYLYLVPYRVIGYLALSYLLYVTVLDAITVAVSAAVGLASCVGCAFPLFTELAAGVGGVALVGTISALSVDLSTAVFVVAVGLLYWRPRLRS